MNMEKIISPSGFKEFLLADSVQDVTIRGEEKGLVIALRAGTKDFVLGRSRGGVRYFQSLDGAVSMLINHGINQFGLCLREWVPRTIDNKKRKSPVDPELSLKSGTHT